MAIENGILEGLCTLDRGVTETVIAEGIGSDVIPHESTDRNPDLVAAIMRRDIKADWTMRDNVRAKLRSSIKRLLVLHRYPPDKQPEAIKLLIEQMEAMAPRYAA